jgi:hypothetical protein
MWDARPMITMYSACRVRESRTEKENERTVYRKVRDAIPFSLEKIGE